MEIKSLFFQKPLAEMEKIRTFAAAFDAKKPMPKFEVYLDKAGKTRFRLKAKNGQIIAVGEAYETHKACLAGVASVKKNAVDAKVVAAS